MYWMFSGGSGGALPKAAARKAPVSRQASSGRAGAISGSVDDAGAIYGKPRVNSWTQLAAPHDVPPEVSMLAEPGEREAFSALRARFKPTDVHEGRGALGSTSDIGFLPVLSPNEAAAVSRSMNAATVELMRLGQPAFALPNGVLDAHQRPLSSTARSAGKDLADMPRGVLKTSAGRVARAQSRFRPFRSGENLASLDARADAAAFGARIARVMFPFY